jgi:hypothetical protein
MPREAQVRFSGIRQGTVGHQQTHGNTQAEKDKYAGKLPQESGNVSLNGERFKIDDAQKKLTIEDSKLNRQELN